ncbi:MAG: C4-type zinc ribbon domain-containing protein [Treponema sp.]|jgi:predicted  nucleic acid-binding Zn-ribbon protein|nr:C4-type zinc ribbon domain-containing protein [Treponema sp.]
METTLVLDKLKELQDVLAEKYRYEELIRHAPQQLTAQEELLARLKKEYIEKSADCDEVKEKVRKLKAELFEAESAKERGEKGMDDISSHREFEILDKEIKDAKDMEIRIRRDLQREEKQLAELNETLNSEEQLIKSQEEELNAGKESLASEIESYNAKIVELAERETQITTGIDEEVVFKFERIMKSERIINSKQSQGIVAVKGNVCEGCHMILPAQFANEVRSGNKIVFCPYCSRILYYQELETGEAEYFQAVDTGSLADFDNDLSDFEADDEEGGVEVMEEDVAGIEFEE